MNDFSIIIPSKTAENLDQCLNSIFEKDFGHNIIVVDDGLPNIEDLVEMRVNVVAGEKPFVFSRNINIGIKAAGDNDVIILNDDTKLETKEGFTKLSQIAAANPAFGIISAATNAATVWQRPVTNDSLRAVERVVSFVCVYVRREVIKEVGLLDERFTAYGWDDNDYCRRCTDSGLMLGVYDGCFVDHLCGVSTYRGGPTNAGDIRQGARIYHDKYPDDEVSARFI